MGLANFLSQKRKGEESMKLDLTKTNGSSPPLTDPFQTHSQLLQDEVWAVAEVANHLKLSRRQVWELTRRRGQLRSDHPIPFVCIHRKNLRFCKCDVQHWFHTPCFTRP